MANFRPKYHPPHLLHPSSWPRELKSRSDQGRCSKSCKLRWTHYLRPGFKRGNFTDQEEKMIVYLEALLGNRRSAMAAQLPQRTDNDIKNYWNAHLKKKLLGKQEEEDQCHNMAIYPLPRIPHSISRGQWERRLQSDIHLAQLALYDALAPEKSPSYETGRRDPALGLYPSSTKNFAKLLRGWNKDKDGTPKSGKARAISAETLNSVSHIIGSIGQDTGSSMGGMPVSRAKSPDMYEPMMTGLESFDDSSLKKSDMSLTLSLDNNNNIVVDEGSSNFQNDDGETLENA